MTKYYWGDYKKSFIRGERSPSDYYIIEKGHPEWLKLKDSDLVVEKPFKHKDASYNHRGQILVEIYENNIWVPHILDPVYNYYQEDVELFEKLKKIAIPHVYKIQARVQEQTGMILEVIGSLDTPYKIMSIPDQLIKVAPYVDITELSSNIDQKIQRVVEDSTLAIFLKENEITVSNKWE